MVDVQVIPDDEAHGELPAEVEVRIRRLEAAVSALQDTPLMEERVAERVIQRLKKTPIKALRDSAETLVDPNGQLSNPAEVKPAAARAPTDRKGWLMFDLWSELRSIGRMFFDHRYRFSWIGRVVPIVIVTVYVCLWLFIPDFFVFTIIERLIDVVLIVFLYYVLSRESRLYRSQYP